jgi:S-adenosylmethionine hydrolase
MKGVILSRCPDARIIDLGHQISPQDVFEAALFLAQSAPRFPAGTVHVVVVDPGVGTHRRPVAVTCAIDGEETNTQIFVCPDNGVLSILRRNHTVTGAWVISEARHMRSEISATFHGRDIFSPAGADLACGLRPDQLGPTAGELVNLELPEPRYTEGHLQGEIIHVDHFGNLLTNITRDTEGVLHCSGLIVEGTVYGPVHKTYADVASGEPVVLWNSFGLLELAVREGNASLTLGLERGQTVSLALGADQSPG